MRILALRRNSTLELHLDAQSARMLATLLVRACPLGRESISDGSQAVVAAVHGPEWWERQRKAQKEQSESQPDTATRHEAGTAEN